MNTRRIKPLLGLTAILTLTACGVETAGTAATAAAIKKNEIEQGRATLEQAQVKIQQSLDMSKDRTDSAEDK